MACVVGPSSFLASGCTFEHNSCLDVLGGGAITMDGSRTDSEPPWVALDRCTFYENSCNVRFCFEILLHGAGLMHVHGAIPDIYLSHPSPS